MGQIIGPIDLASSFIPNILLNIIVVGALSLAFAKLSYHTFEEPFLGLRRRYVK